MTLGRRARRDKVVAEEPAATMPEDVRAEVSVNVPVVVNIGVSATVVEPEAPHPHYTLGQWKGYTRYICNYCAFDTLDQVVAEGHWPKHYQDMSPVEQERRARLGILIANSSGSVVREV